MDKIKRRRLMRYLSVASSLEEVTDSRGGRKLAPTQYTAIAFQKMIEDLYKSDAKTEEERKRDEDHAKSLEMLLGSAMREFQSGRVGPTTAQFAEAYETEISQTSLKEIREFAESVGYEGIMPETVSKYGDRTLKEILEKYNKDLKSDNTILKEEAERESKAVLELINIIKELGKIEVKKYAASKQIEILNDAEKYREQKKLVEQAQKQQAAAKAVGEENKFQSLINGKKQL